MRTTNKILETMKVKMRVKYPDGSVYSVHEVDMKNAKGETKRGTIKMMLRTQAPKKGQLSLGLS
tara:strand:+ start:400 stop:591 length:192 start_codon:yes stop_codon:yes gene_type:complete